MSCQVSAAVGRAVLAAVVLLVEPLRIAGGHHELVDALPGDRQRVRHEIGPDAGVARLPGQAAVTGLERPDRRDRDPHPVRVGGMGHDRVEDQPACSGLPGRPARMVRQALDVGPRPAAIVAPEQTGDPDPGVHAAMSGRDVPDGADLRAVFAVGQAVARLGPRLAEVVAPEDGRSVPGRAAAGVQRARRRVAADVLDRVALAGRSADRPRSSIRVGLDDEGSLLRPHEEQHSVGHHVLLGSSGSRAGRLQMPRVATSGRRSSAARRRPLVADGHGTRSGSARRQPRRACPGQATLGRPWRQCG